jgi:arginase
MRASVERDAGPGGFWIHLDVHVLDDAIMPAVDYRLPDGLGWNEVSIVLPAAVASPRAVGLEITIFNSTLDRDGRHARELVDVLADGLAHRGSGNRPASRRITPDESGRG